MKFGIMFANMSAFAQPEHAAELAQAAEDVGIESLWAIEHVIVPKQYDSTYPYHKTGKLPF